MCFLGGCCFGVVLGGCGVEDGNDLLEYTCCEMSRPP
jgi:hypothetical protein